MIRSGRFRRAFLGLSALLLLAVASIVILLPIISGHGGAKSDTDDRIAFYKARLGGRGTYPAYARLGAAYLQKARETGDTTDLDLADRHLRKSLEFQRNYEAIRWLAVVSLTQHRFREALQYAKEAAETMPSDLECRGVLSDVHMALGNTEEAIAIVDKMAASSRRFSSLARIASIRQYEGKLTDAIAAMQDACAAAERERLPRETAAWCQVQLGSMLVARCNPGEAEEAYKRALGHLPGYFLAAEHLAELRSAQGQTSQAIREYKSLLERRPDPRYRIALSELYELNGDKQRGAEEREKATAELRESSHRGSKADWPALVSALLHDPKTAPEALLFAQKDWEERQDWNAADSLAWAYYKNDRHEEACAIIEPFLNARLKQPRLMVHGALICIKLHRMDKARALIREALACPLPLTPLEHAEARKAMASLP